MAPKKNANVSIEAALKTTDAADGNPVKVAKKRPAASRVTKAKPLRTPSLIKVKIKKPCKKKDTEILETLGESVSDDKPIKYERHMQKEHLIELANQVAQFQLVKPNVSPQPGMAKDAVVKVGRPKKSKKAAEVNVEKDVEKQAPAPKSQKKAVKPKTPKAPPKPRVRKPKVSENAQNEAQSEKAPPKKRKSRAKPKCKKNEETSQEVQLAPDILNELRTFHLSTTPKTSSITYSRSSSRASVPTDNFSWIKEISSSSNTTPTKELVCINGKLPEIKLVDCRKTGRRQCKRILDEIDSLSDSTKTSDSSNKRRKVVKNTFRMSQRKFRLSLKKRNSNINSQSLVRTIENPYLPRPLEISTCNNTKAATNNNHENMTSSSSEISRRTNVDLSSSSSSSTSQSTPMTTDSVLKQTHVKDIRQKLDSLDLEFINWLGDDDKNINLNKLRSEFSDILKLENEAIKESQHFKLRLSNSSSERSSERNAAKTNSVAEENSRDNAQIVSNSLEDLPNCADSNETNENDANTLNKDNIEPLQLTDGVDNIRGKSCAEANYINDDEDALSIYAESLTAFTCMESSKMSSVGSYKPARSPQFSPDRDVAEPSVPDFTESYSYFTFSSDSDSSPNKLREVTENSQNKFQRDTLDGTVNEPTQKPKYSTCVKKIADSTSVQRDEGYPLPYIVPKVDTPPPVLRANQSKSSMMGVNFFSTPAVKSQVFRGVCFFNLISKCKCKNICNFPHQIIPIQEIESRLLRLHENHFICEYMLLRKYPTLRANYITAFVSECSRRDLTQILLEMVIDCYREELNIRTHALETALLNISNKNLNDFHFFLTYDSEIMGHKLCDVLIKSVSETQNFTRLKQVFVKLTDFMVLVGRKFELDVAGKILERICILPFEESLADAMIKIIRNTSVDIFKNASMCVFESRLEQQNMDLMKKLQEYKSAGLGIELSPFTAPNTSSNIVGVLNGHVPGLDKPEEAEKRRYTSPDTTHLEMNQNKFDNLLRITRTINTSNNTKTYTIKPAPILSPEKSNQRLQLLARPLPPLRRPVLWPSALNLTSRVNNKPEGNPKFSLLSKRFGRDAPFW